MSPYEIDSRRTFEKMKIKVADEPTVDHKVIYEIIDGLKRFD